ncbi:TEL2, telomere maintenance protein 2 [Bulinus truncatus]|nr:TEL2, telomere maintenance protein 2 [Bulinus truncatus]
MEVQPLALVKEITNGLHTADSKEDIIKWLTVIRTLFVPRYLNDTNCSLYGYDYSTLLNIRDVFTSQYAKRIYEKLVSRFTVEWISELTIDVFNSHVLPIFLEGPQKDSFIVLLNTITGSEKKNFGVYKCVSILEKFVCRDTLTHLLCSESRRGGSLHSNVFDVDAEILLGYLSLFSEKVANKLQQENSEIFLPQNYIPTLALAVLDTLLWGHDLLVKSEDVSLLFVSSLVGKICLTGYADFLLDTLLPHVSLKVRTDYIWCRICERVFAGVPDRCLESVVVPLLKKISWYGLVDKFLGDCVVHNSGIKMLICTKLLLYRCYPKPKQLLQNIVGYLTSFHSRRYLFVEVILSLIKVWSDRSSMKHISAEQHLYITRALMVCTGALNEQEKNTLKGELVQTLIHGVEAHLESSDPTVRTLGMTVAKTLTYAIDPSGPQLEFDLDLTNQMVKDLLSYRELPEDPGLTLEENILMAKINQTAVTTTEKQNVLCENVSVERNTEKNIQDYDLDSDDDLEPYDMSNDVKVTKSAPPKYVRECMEGLICSSDDPDKTEVCLQHAAALIRRKTTDLDEIAVEFAKILLHLENTHSFDNFLLNRFSALVALTVNCPHKVAEYLSSQFYERNYSSRQRMDILEVLANAAQELSQPEKPNQENWYLFPTFIF